jgi:apolipoprotein N-acyltransferase
LNSELSAGARAAGEKQFKIQNSKFKIVYLWPWLAAAASGVLLALCFAPWNITPLVWVALAPLICAVWFSPASARRAGLREAKLGYVAGFVFFTLVFYWLGALGTLFRQPLLYGLPPLLALLFGLYFAFWSWFLGRVLAPSPEARLFRNSWRNLATGALGASAWAAQEWVRSWLLSGFGWDGLGVALHGDLPMIQITALTGVLGLSWLVAFVNLMIVIVIRRIVGELGPQFVKRIRWEFSLSVALVVCVFSYGVRELLTKAPEAIPLRVTAVQPNIPQDVKFSAAGEDEIFRELGGLTQLAVAANKPQLLIWPESATPRGIYADELNYRFVMDHAELGDFGLLLGTVEDDLESGRTYNVAKLFTGRGAQEQTHRKMHLVPFGEYLPLRPILSPIVGGLVPGDFDPGEVATVFELPEPRIKLSALICFEDTLGDLTRRFAKNGAQLLVNLTNDGWFLHTAGAEQHLHNAIFRAVENRRPLIRCTNSGVTCSIDRHGHVDHWLRPFQQGFAARQVDVPSAAVLSFYTRHGDWFAQLASVVTLLAMVRRRWQR